MVDNTNSEDISSKDISALKCYPPYAAHSLYVILDDTPYVEKMAEMLQHRRDLPGAHRFYASVAWVRDRRSLRDNNSPYKASNFGYQ